MAFTRSAVRSRSAPPTESANENQQLLGRKLGARTSVHEQTCNASTRRQMRLLQSGAARSVLSGHCLRTLIAGTADNGRVQRNNLRLAVQDRLRRHDHGFVNYASPTLTSDPFRRLGAERQSIFFVNEPSSDALSGASAVLVMDDNDLIAVWYEIPSRQSGRGKAL